MAASSTSPDGTIVIERIEVQGRAYDLPPWLDESEFREGLTSDDDENALASLTACKFSRWEENEDYDADYPEDGPAWLAIFELTWTLPYGSVRELAAEVFTPLPAASWPRGDFFEVEFTASGATVRGCGSAYRDFNDVQAYLVRGELADFDYAPGGDGGYLGEALDEFKANPAAFMRYASGPEGQINLHVDDSGVPHLLVIKIHED